MKPGDEYMVGGGVGGGGEWDEKGGKHPCGQAAMVNTLDDAGPTDFP